MPLFCCTNCSHEWEDENSESLCDWCGDEGNMVEKYTTFDAELDYLDWIEEDG